MKPGLSSLLIYKLCFESSALILIPLISTILGSPPKSVPQTDRVCFSVVIINLIKDWYSDSLWWLTDEISIDLLLATIDELIKFTLSTVGLSKAKIIVCKMGWLLIFAVCPSNSTCTDLIGFSVNWPAKLPSKFANFR